MKNEEKAREIANRHKIEYISGLKDERGTSFIECMGSSMEMAEWKDKQFKEYLEKKSQKLILSKNWVDGLKLQFLGEIFNELFGETEEVDHSNNDE